MSESINRTRRGFVAFGALAAVGWRQLAFAAGTNASGTVGPPLAELNYGQVKFGEGPLERQARENHRLVLG
ncbi:MAG TPA: hypothetical protein VHU43_03760, partial [Steroidobacteraceae bacterium]|nr:hypothetical protein [Steroidobacteraceae bacterium]